MPKYENILKDRKNIDSQGKFEKFCKVYKSTVIGNN